MATVKTNLNELEKQITAIILQRITPRQIILLGSRARGDSKEFSDYDIAIDMPMLTDRTLSLIRDDMELLRTLKTVDVLWYNRLNPLLKQRIVSEGIVLYD